MNATEIEKEFEKKSRINNPTSVNWDIVKSAKYRDKFFEISGDDEVDALLHRKAIDILNHRDNTEFEDMHLIHLGTKQVVGSQTHSSIAQEINYNDSLKTANKRYIGNTLISIHNHPYNLPPSGEDIESNYYHEYRLGVIVCHNGSLYIYQSSVRVTVALLEYQVVLNKKPPYNMAEDDAYRSALLKYGVRLEER